MAIETVYRKKKPMVKVTVMTLTIFNRQNNNAVYTIQLAYIYFSLLHVFVVFYYTFLCILVERNRDFCLKVNRDVGNRRK